MLIRTGKLPRTPLLLTEGFLGPAPLPVARPAKISTLLLRLLRAGPSGSEIRMNSFFWPSNFLRPPARG
jgi:hypothetical protein